MTERQLMCIWKNGQRRGRIVRAADRVPTLVRKFITPADAARNDDLTEVIGRIDTGFAAQCRFGGLQTGTLTIFVTDPRLVPYVRMEWLFRLRDWLKSQRPELFIAKIEFRPAPA